MTAHETAEENGKSPLVFFCFVSNGWLEKNIKNKHKRPTKKQPSMSKFKAEVKRCKKTIFDTRANWTYLNKNLSYRYVVALKRADGRDGKR